jgi:hypothetical protein
VPSIDVEVCVEGEDEAVRMCFGHENEGRIGEGNGTICVAREEAMKPRSILLRSECCFDQTSLHEVENSCGSAGKGANEKNRLGQDRFAGEEWRRQAGHLFDRPCMVSISAIEKGDQRTRVEKDDGSHRP